MSAAFGALLGRVRRRLPRRLGGFESQLLLLVLLVALPLASVSAYAFLDRRQSDSRAVQAQSENLGAVLAESERLTIASASQTLVAVAGFAATGSWTPDASDPAACNAYVTELLHRSSIYTNIGIATRAGDITCSAAPLTGAVNIADREYFQRAVESGDFAIGGFQRGRITGLYTITAGYPLFDRAGQIRGVAFAALDLGVLADLIEHASLPPASEAALLDGTGTIVAHFPATGAVGQRWDGMPQLLARIEGGRAAAEATGTDGVRRYYSLRAFSPGRGASEAYVAVGIPVAAVYAESNLALRRSLLALAAIFLVAMLAARMLAQAALIQPIHRIIATAAAIGTGSLAARLGPRYPGSELGVLGREIDVMAGRLEVQEQHLRLANRDLERRVEERTADLRALATREQLAREEADRANQAKSEFLSQMSHELRTPLNAVLGFTDLLEERAGSRLEPRELQYIEHVRTGGEHLLGLINDVLDLARVEAGRTQLFVETVTVGQLIEPVVDSTRLAAEPQGITFTVEAALDMTLSLDPGRMRQILFNLLSNAVKFTPAGGAVWLRLRGDGSVLDIEVADTGIGIPLDRQGRVFGTFERLHEDLNSIGGTGIGLALTRRLVELQQGEISFESVGGVGTTFRVRIPNVVRGQTQGHRLLIVEDEAASAELIVEHAAQVGLQCQVVNSVGTALEAVRLAQPTAAIVDLRLRGERGEEFLAALKGDPATRHIPVLVLSIEDDTGLTRSLGAEDHLTKPVDIHRLLEWLRRVAGQQKETDAHPAR